MPQDVSALRPLSASRRFSRLARDRQPGREAYAGCHLDQPVDGEPRQFAVLNIRDAGLIDAEAFGDGCLQQARGLHPLLSFGAPPAMSSKSILSIVRPIPAA